MSPSNNEDQAPYHTSDSSLCDGPDGSLGLNHNEEANFKNYNHNNVLEGNGGVVLDKYDDRGGYGDCDDGGRYSNCDDGGTYSNGYDEGRYKDFDDAGGYKNFEDGGYGPNYD
ncbi:hypothetical protein PSTG_06532 [Puccinia striiformis f. sp. tritici PST-78]|uniref:Uncharacterized protein n=1 Tax=Puccinia striiformis f. sp. tritici PST-78 TaxID=1165861 RepID=A0A0L0VM90_9BASI|nr:hypothetical protein PSTG_06532 [Puccinia striiformis f. sp. tritici PST-78]